MPGRDLFAGSGSGTGGRDLFVDHTPRKKKAHHGGFLHAVGSAFRNTGKGIVALGPGLYHVGEAVARDLKENPTLAATLGGTIAWDAAHGRNTFKHTYKDVVVPMGKSYAHKYGPLGQFDFGEFAHRALVEDPLGTVGDVATVLSLGAGAGVRAGLLPASARSVKVLSPGARAGQEAMVIEKGIAGRTQLGRHLRIVANNAKNRLPADFPILGETDRYGKALRQRHDRTVLAKGLKADPLRRAEQRLSTSERIAANLMHDFPSRKLLDMKRAQLAANPKADPAGLAQMSDPKVLAKFDHPTPRMRRYLDESRKLGEENAIVANIHPQTALERRYQSALILHGAQKTKEGLVAPGPKAKYFRGTAPHRPRSTVGEIHGTSDWDKNIFVANSENIARNYVGPGGMVERWALAPNARVMKVDPTAWARRMKTRRPGDPSEFLLAQAEVERARAAGYDLIEFPDQQWLGTVVINKNSLVPEGPTIPQMIADIRAEIQAEGRPEPLYRKHASIQETRGTSIGAGGAAPQPLRAPGARQNLATLDTMGRVAYNIDTLTPAYLKNVKWAVYTDKHADLVASGRLIPKGTPLRPGEEFLKQTRSEKIGYTEQTAGDFERAIQEDLGHELITRNEAEAFETPDGYRVVIPSRLREKVISEYTRNSKAVDWFFKKPTNVWRALVLNLRVGWLVNNIVGNSLLYAVSNAGPRGLRAYMGAIADIHGIRAALRLVDDEKITRRITPADMAELLPEQVAGTFFGTQTPAAGKFGKSRVGRAVLAAPRVLRHVDIGYEQALRRAIANRVLRGSPEIKARLRAMPKETRSWRAAARQELRNPTAADRVSAEINRALGDFRNLSDLEQRVLRSAAPFYAWYRAITLIMAKMPLDNPVRTDILAQLGELGEQVDADAYPFGGAIDLGGGNILKTAGINPYQTLPQMAENTRILGQAALAGLAPGVRRPDDYDVQRAAGILNPLLTAPFHGASQASVAENLPPVRLAHPYKPRHPERGVYDDYGRLAELLQYLGVPIRHLRQP